MALLSDRTFGFCCPRASVGRLSHWTEPSRVGSAVKLGYPFQRTLWALKMQNVQEPAPQDLVPCSFHCWVISHRDDPGFHILYGRFPR